MDGIRVYYTIDEKTVSVRGAVTFSNSTGITWPLEHETLLAIEQEIRRYSNTAPEVTVIIHNIVPIVDTPEDLATQLFSNLN